MIKGDIILIPFPFTDLSEVKNRPALVLVESDSTIIVSFITSQLNWREDFDIELLATEETGLRRISLLRLNKLSTLHKNLVIGRLGSLREMEINEVNQKLIKMLRLF